MYFVKIVVVTIVLIAAVCIVILFAMHNSNVGKNTVATKEGCMKGEIVLRVTGYTFTKNPDVLTVYGTDKIVVLKDIDIPDGTIMPLGKVKIKKGDAPRTYTFIPIK